MQMSPRVRWVLLGTPALVLVLYCCDWAALRLRIAHGEGLGSFQVRHFVSTPLKGNREDYYLLDSADQQCVRSALPHGGLSPAAGGCSGIATSGSRSSSMACEEVRVALGRTARRRGWPHRGATPTLSLKRRPRGEPYPKPLR